MDLLGRLTIAFGVDFSELDDAGARLQRVGSQFTQLGAVVTGAVTVPIVALGAAAIAAAIDFESAMTGVAKTVDAPAAVIAQMGDEFQRLSEISGITAVELGKVGESAGQLGVPTGDIVEFTRVMGELGVSTNLSADQAATALAQFSNITKTSFADVDRLASTIVALGNAGASTEADIVNMALNLAGAGEQAGLTEAQILGFANALSSVGIEAEKGGSAFSRVFLQMQSDVATGGGALEQFAAVAGLSVAGFSDLFRRDAAGAVIAFVEGLGAMDPATGEAIVALDNMGISEIRLRDTLLRAASASDLFADSVSLGTQAWQQNSAATEEAAKFYASTAVQLDSLKNKATNTAADLGATLLPAFRDLISVASGLLDFVRSVVEGFGRLPGPVQTTIASFVGLLVAMGPIITAIGLFISLLPGLTIAATALGTTVGVLVGSFFAIPLAIAAVVAAGIAVVKNWDAIKAAALDLIGPVAEGFRSFVSGLVGAWETIRAGASALADGVVSAFSRLAGAVGAAFSALGERLQVITVPLANLGRAFVDLGAAVLDVVQAIAGRITDLLAPALETLGVLFTLARDTVVAAVAAMAQSVLGTLQGLGDLVAAALGGVAEVVAAVLSPALDLVASLFRGMSDLVVGIAGGMIDLVFGAFARLGDLVNLVAAGLDKITGLFRFMADVIVGHSIVPDMVDAIGVQLQRMVGLMAGLARAAVDAVADAFRSAKDIAADAWNAVESATKKAWKAIERAVTKAAGGVGDVIAALVPGPVRQLVLGTADMAVAVARSFGELRDKVGEAVRETAENVVGSLVEGLASLADLVREAVLDPVARAFSTFADASARLFSALADKIPEVMAAGLARMADAVNAHVARVRDFFAGLADDLVGHSIIPDMVTAIGGEFDRLGTLMDTGATTAVTNATVAFADIEGRMAGVMSREVQAIDDLMRELGTKMPESVRDTLDKVGGAWGKIKQVLEIPLIDTIDNSIVKWVEFAKVVIDIVKFIWHNVGDLIAKIGDFFKGLGGGGNQFQFGTGSGPSGPGAGGSGFPDVPPPGTPTGFSLADDLLIDLLEGSRAFWVIAKRQGEELLAGLGDVVRPLAAIAASVLVLEQGFALLASTGAAVLGATREVAGFSRDVAVLTGDANALLKQIAQNTAGVAAIAVQAPAAVVQVLPAEAAAVSEDFSWPLGEEALREISQGQTELRVSANRAASAAEHALGTGRETVAMLSGVSDVLTGGFADVVSSIGAVPAPVVNVSVAAAENAQLTLEAPEVPPVDLSGLDFAPLVDGLSQLLLPATRTASASELGAAGIGDVATLLTILGAATTDGFRSLTEAVLGIRLDTPVVNVTVSGAEGAPVTIEAPAVAPVNLAVLELAAAQALQQLAALTAVSTEGFRSVSDAILGIRLDVPVLDVAQEFEWSAGEIALAALAQNQGAAAEGAERTATALEGAHAVLVEESSMLAQSFAVQVEIRDGIRTLTEVLIAKEFSPTIVVQAGEQGGESPSPRERGTDGTDRDLADNFDRQGRYDGDDFF